MEPTLKHIDPFTVAGISVRTINSDEGDAATSKLGPLWNRFFAEDMMHTIPGSVPDSFIYGVYTDYESDMNGHYTTTVGMKVEDDRSRGDGITEVNVEGGDYLVFEKSGEIPAIVIEAWGDVWRYFSEQKEYVRRYTTDFEEYRTRNTMAVYIAVRKVE